MDPTVKGDTSRSADTQQFTQPEVRKLGKKRSGDAANGTKRTSSRGVRRLTDINKRVTKALRRVTRAMDSGVDTYIEQRDKSAANRKDGVVVDFIENAAQGVSRTVSEAAPVLTDVAEALNTRRFRKQVRRFASTFRRIPLVG